MKKTMQVKTSKNCLKPKSFKNYENNCVKQLVTDASYLDKTIGVFRNMSLT